MTRLLIAAICSVVLTSPTLAGPPKSSRDVQVRGYTNKNGTRVSPHHGSNPDGNFKNNWSTKGNINPYTLKEGTKVTPPTASGNSAYSRSYRSGFSATYATDYPTGFGPGYVHPDSPARSPSDHVDRYLPQIGDPSLPLWVDSGQWITNPYVRPRQISPSGVKQK